MMLLWPWVHTFPRNLLTIKNVSLKSDYKGILKLGPKTHIHLAWLFKNANAYGNEIRSTVNFSIITGKFYWHNTELSE